MLKRTTEERPLRVVLWTAVSSAKQAADDKVSLSEQERLGREWAAAQGADVVELLTVPGHTRSESDIVSLLDDYAREGIFAYHRLRELWGQHPRQFDVLWCYADNRLARDPAPWAWIVSCVIKSGARIYMHIGGWISNVDVLPRIALGSMTVSGEIKRLVELGQATKEKAAARGLPTNGNPGVSHIAVRTPLGKIDRVEVNPDALPLFHAIAELLLQDVSWSAMPPALAERGFVMPDGKLYAPARLQKMMYAPATWGHRARRATYDRKSHRQNAPVAMWSVEPGHSIPDEVTIFYHIIPPVFEGALADDIRAELRRRSSTRRSNKHARARTLSGVLSCAECGAALAESHGRYRCMTIYQRGACPRPARIEMTVALEEVRTLIDRALQSAARSIEHIDLSGRDNELAQAQSLARDLQTRIGRIIDEQSKAPEAARVLYRQKVEELSAQWKTATERVQRLEREQAARERASDSEAALAQARTLGANWLWAQDEATINQWLHRLLGDKRFSVRGGHVTGLQQSKKRGVKRRQRHS